MTAHTLHCNFRQTGWWYGERS